MKVLFLDACLFDSIISVQYCITSDNDIENPEAKRVKISIDNTLEKIKANAKTDATLVKQRQQKIISATKNKYVVPSILDGKTNCSVKIYKVSSCTCSDFRKGESHVLCKQIIFTLVYFLQFKDERLLFVTERTGKLPRL